MAIQGTLGVLGFGNMGRALAQGLIETGAMQAANILTFDIDGAKCQAARDRGIAVAESSGDLARRSSYLMLAVKPQNMGAALEEIRAERNAKALVISIAAGISMAFIQERLGVGARVVRVMPNTPAMVRAGAAGVALSANCTDADAAVARAIFESVGVCEIVPEASIDAITALSGSGPAYFFYMVECLVKAATAQGLPEDQATRLAAQTLLGAGRLLSESGEPAAVLRERVTSKGGTTEAALKRFGEEGFERIIRAGVAAAAARSKELGK